MRRVRIMVAALAAAALVGCDGTNPLSAKAMSPGSITRQAVAGDVVHLHLPVGAPVGTLFLIKSYTPRAEPFSCTAGGITTHTFVGEVTAVAPGYTTGPANAGGSGIMEGISTSMAVAPNTRLRIESVASFCGGWVQTAVVQ